MVLTSGLVLDRPGDGWKFARFHESRQAATMLAAEKPIIDPALASLIVAWPTLGDAILVGILAMVRAAGG